MRRLGIVDEGKDVRCHMVIWLYYLAILVLWWDGSNFIIIEPRISVFMVVFGAAFAALLIAVLFGRQRIVRLPQLIPLLILAFWIVFTAITAQYTSLAITTLYTWFNRLLLAGTTAWVILTRVQVRRLAKMLIFACLVSALLMILQFTLRMGFVNPKNVKRLVAGTSWRSAIVGFYMMAPMALMAAYAIFGRGTKRVSAGILAVLFGLATLYSGTRSTFAGLMVILAMLMLARPGLGRARSIVLGVLLAVAVALVFSRVLPERTQRLMQKAEVARSDIRFDYLWPEAWRLFKENPVLGIGPGGVCRPHSMVRPQFGAGDGHGNGRLGVFTILMVAGHSVLQLPICNEAFAPHTRWVDLGRFVLRLPGHGRRDRLARIRRLAAGAMVLGGPVLRGEKSGKAGIRGPGASIIPSGLRGPRRVPAAPAGIRDVIR